MAFPLPDAGVMNGDTQCSIDYLVKSESNNKSNIPFQDLSLSLQVIPAGSEDGTLTNSRDRFCGVTLGPCMIPAGQQAGGTCQDTAGPVTCKII